MKKLFIIVNEDRFYLLHRKEITLAAQRAGWDVTMVCKDTGRRHELEKTGLKVHIGGGTVIGSCAFVMHLNGRLPQVFLREWS